MKILFNIFSLLSTPTVTAFNSGSHNLLPSYCSSFLTSLPAYQTPSTWWLKQLYCHSKLKKVLACNGSPRRLSKSNFNCSAHKFLDDCVLLLLQHHLLPSPNLSPAILSYYSGRFGCLTPVEHLRSNTQKHRKQDCSWRSMLELLGHGQEGYLPILLQRSHKQKEREE